MHRRTFLAGSTATGAALVAGVVTPDPALAAAAPEALTGKPAPARAPRQPRSFGRVGRDFPKVGGDYGNQNHTPLARIDRRNVHRLGGAWHVNLEGGSTASPQQSTVVAEHGVLYVQTTQQHVVAVDGRTGEEKWRASVGTETTNMRGVALDEHHVFTISGENNVYALDKQTGAVVWKTLLLTEDAGTGDTGGCDPTNGQCGGSVGSLAGAVVYWDGLIYVGMQGSTAGARGRAYALHADTGELAWTFWSAPGPGEYGHDTWEGDSWKTGGAVPWIHPALDPDTGTVLWTFGNPYPRTNGSTRGGDNLFANCLVALDAKTGRRKWHFQSVHHDIWDYDNVMAPVLADVRVKGRLRKVVVYGSKVGKYFVLDRTNGKPIQGVTERAVPQDPRQKTAPTQPEPAGESFLPQKPRFDNATRPVPFYPVGGVFDTFWDRATIIFPGAGGGADWGHVSFNPETGWIYVGYGLINSAYSNTVGGRVNTARPLGEYFGGGIAAVDPRDNTVVWSIEKEWSLAHGNGILTTGGGVMFQGGPDGLLHAMDDRTADVLWSFQCGAGVHTSPIAYEVDGEQYLAVFAGGNSLPYPDIPRGDHLWAFKLGGRVSEAATPTPPSKRNQVRTAPVTAAAAGNTVTLGRVWDTATGKPGTTENLVAQNAMSPQHLTVPKGTTITFVNPADNATAHGAVAFFEYEFDTGTLMPGQSFQHTFDRAGEFFYNDPIYPQSTAKIIVT
ncbi:twin-arginine translocation signal domain-containing protein [Nocardioides mangrovicus]|uniref:Twin-arginine translocation signal domain-containing protein n=1 Tax=Nocardioides mangrovicus TaxID=2478913 RepID=A0A3L8P6M5_9ACTN|nr:PQQ-binding-like beta-propeller repeat protein [Nocardioides mangrovicus]RLV50363.1 twin-arginine translocation signal domain-containing protein [Nocardioides mangrovicus]